MHVSSGSRALSRYGTPPLGRLKSDNLNAGVSAFVDADMNEASTRFQALHTQQQLGVQALSIANQNSQMILRLFQ